MTVKDCPFCGCRLEDIGNKQYFHPKNSCWLEKEFFDFSDNDYLELWNMRGVHDYNKIFDSEETK